MKKLNAYFEREAKKAATTYKECGDTYYDGLADGIDLCSTMANMIFAPRPIETALRYPLIAQGQWIFAYCKTLGEWVRVNWDGDFWRCSDCLYEADTLTHWLPLDVLPTPEGE